MNAKEKRKWCTRYIADCNNGKKTYSHGYEALLDYQLSWNCRIACYYKCKTRLKRQCDHILNVLVNPSYKKGDPQIELQDIFVYKQWGEGRCNRTDLIMELIYKSGKKAVVLVENKAFTDFEEKQLLDYPVMVANDYDNNNKEFGKDNYEFLLRVVSSNTDDIDSLKKEVEKITKGKTFPGKKWEVLNANNLLLTNKKGDYLPTGNPLFDEFWITDRCAVDSSEFYDKIHKMNCYK